MPPWPPARLQTHLVSSRQGYCRRILPKQLCGDLLGKLHQEGFGLTQADPLTRATPPRSAFASLNEPESRKDGGAPLGDPRAQVGAEWGPRII